MDALPPATCCQKTRHFVKIFWRGIFSVVWPIIWLPILICFWSDNAYRCLYLVIVMAGYWVTECVPLAISSTLPIVFFPIVGIASTGEICMVYFKETNVMFLGGIMIALAVEHSKLHYRIALCFILLIGCSPRRLHFGVMMITMFTSWWMSNTAATAMMCPIIMAVLEELEKQGMGSVYKPLSEEDADLPEAEVKLKRVPTDSTLAYFLAAAYSSTIGGCATLVGTGTNLTFRGLFDQYELEEKVKNPRGINFGKFVAMNGPVMLLINLAVYFILEIMYLGLWRPKSEQYALVQKGKELKNVAREVLKQKYKDLGSITWHESWVLGLFCATILLWIFRDPGFMPGVTAISPKKIGDATICFLIITLLFLIPAKPWCIRSCSKDPSNWPTKSSEGLITWKLLHTKVPWGLMFLLGGGFALAKGSSDSGMSKLVSSWLSAMKVLPNWVVMCLCAIFASFMTELSANVAIANIVIPITLQLAKQLHTDALHLSMPTAIACSFAFMLPVGTPPNAVAAGYVNIPTSQMAKAGIIVSCVALIIYLAAIETYGRLLYTF